MRNLKLYWSVRGKKGNIYYTKSKKRGLFNWENTRTKRYVIFDNKFRVVFNVLPLKNLSEKLVTKFNHHMFDSNAEDKSIT